MSRGPYQSKLKRQKAFIQSYAYSFNLSKALAESQVSRSTFYDWLKKCPKFKAAIIELDEVCLDEVEQEVRKMIKAGNFPAAKYYLGHKGTQRGWTLAIRHEVSGPGGGPIPYEVIDRFGGSEREDEIGPDGPRDPLKWEKEREKASQNASEGEIKEESNK